MTTYPTITHSLLRNRPSRSGLRGHDDLEGWEQSYLPRDFSPPAWLRTDTGSRAVHAKKIDLMQRAEQWGERLGRRIGGFARAERTAAHATTMAKQDRPRERVADMIRACSDLPVVQRVVRQSPHGLAGSVLLAGLAMGFAVSGGLRGDVNRLVADVGFQLLTQLAHTALRVLLPLLWAEVLISVALLWILRLRKT